MILFFTEYRKQSELEQAEYKYMTTDLFWVKLFLCLPLFLRVNNGIHPVLKKRKARQNFGKDNEINSLNYLTKKQQLYIIDGIGVITVSTYLMKMLLILHSQRLIG